MKTDKAVIHYHDIGDYLNREEKLAIVKKTNSVANEELRWETLHPNEHGDWISQRSNLFETFIPTDPGKKFDSKAQSFFVINSLGSNTSRDFWVYNSSTKELTANIKKSIEFYNSEVERYKVASKKSKAKLIVTDFLNTDSTKISWSSSLVPRLEKGEEAAFEKNKIDISAYRPFFKQKFYRGDKMIHRRGQLDELFPNPNLKNLVICASAISKDGSVLITDVVPDFHLIGDTQAFPLYYYEENSITQKGLFDGGENTKYTRRDGVTNFILERSQKQFGKTVGKEDIFYYVYGFLHSPLYREKFANDLKKMLPRLPLVEDVKDFWAFSKAGRKLAELHISYESVPTYKGVKVSGADSKFYTVEKMRFPKKDQKDSIIYNSRITVSNIPAKAYEYVVNGKSAIEWIMERYQITTHKESGIKNDPNDWSKEVGNDRYILDLLLSIINVSVQTVEIVEGLPKVRFE